MLPNSILSFILGVVAAYLGFGRLAGVLAFVAKVVAFVCLGYFFFELFRNLFS